MLQEQDAMMRQAYGESRPGFDFYGDGFATVRKGNLPSGQHADPRMNLRLSDLKGE